MMSRKKALEDLSRERRASAACFLLGYQVDSISLTHARLAGFGWTTFPWYATHAPALHAAVLRCLVPGLRTTGLGTFLDLTLMCCADHGCFSCAPAGCIG